MVVLTAHGRMLLPLLLLAGCSSVLGRPPLPADLGAETSGLAPLHSADKITACLAKQVSAQQSCRDEIVQARMITIDANYTRFRNDFYAEARWGSFAATLASLGLTAAASLTPVGTANILGAAATGVTGTQAAYEQRVLVDRTANAIETSMDAGRDLISVRIRSGLRLPPEQYPLAVALSDLEDYYSAGTILGALADITKSAGVQAQQADQQLKTLSGFVQTSAASFLRGYIAPPGATPDVIAQRVRNVEDAERRLPYPYVLATQLSMMGDPAQIEAVARQLGWSGS